MSETKTYRPEGGRRVGLAQRRIAAKIVSRVLAGKALDEQVDPYHGDPMLKHMPARDRAFVKALTTTTFRRLGSLRHVLAEAMDKGLPKRAGLFESILLTAAAQILFLDTADHAAVDQAQMLMAEDRHAKRYAGLANAVLRRLARERDQILAELPADSDLPVWLADRWRATWGAAAINDIAPLLRVQPPLDLSAIDPHAVAAATGGQIVHGHTVRLTHAGLVDKLPGFAEGAWWVQDVAASLPAPLLDVQPSETVADLCAAPGGKTAQLCLAGGKVTAFDKSKSRLQRLRDNLARLNLEAQTQAADVLSLPDDARFDAILLDAPCSATGTLRRHPDIAIHRDVAGIKALADIQSRMLDKAVKLLKPGGRLVFATCSLEPEEGEEQATALLARHGDICRLPIEAQEIGQFASCLTENGDLRVLPNALPASTAELAGADGFFAARFKRHP